MAVTGSMAVPVLVRWPNAADGWSPVGTFSINAEATGNTSGGYVRTQTGWTRDQLGFHALVVPTYISCIDTLGSAEDVVVTYTGYNRRCTDMAVRVDMQAHGSSNYGAVQGSQIVLESEAGTDAAAQQFVRAEWQTNTNSATYHLHIYGVVYDAEKFYYNGHVTGPMLGNL